MALSTSNRLKADEELSVLVFFTFVLRGKGRGFPGNGLVGSFRTGLDWTGFTATGTSVLEIDLEGVSTVAVTVKEVYKWTSG
jgi:hypothetical protein